MPSITALLHTKDDALRLGRCLETLYPCDNILVVDHGSTDATVRVAREYGARVVSGAGREHNLLSIFSSAPTGWILCLGARESLTEALAASLYEWKSESRAHDANGGSAFSVFLREETPEGWIEVPKAQTRLVPPDWKRWEGAFPAAEESAVALEGELLRFVFP